MDSFEKELDEQNAALEAMLNELEDEVSPMIQAIEETEP